MKGQNSIKFIKRTLNVTAFLFGATAILYGQPITLSLNQSLFGSECLFTLRAPINVNEQEDAELLPHTKRDTI